MLDSRRSGALPTKLGGRGPATGVSRSLHALTANAHRPEANTKKHLRNDEINANDGLLHKVPQAVLWALTLNQNHPGLKARAWHKHPAARMFRGKAGSRLPPTPDRAFSPGQECGVVVG